jgi:hypothetical protein
MLAVAAALASGPDLIVALCCLVRAARGKREKDGPVPEGGEAEGGGAHQGE